MDSASGVGYRAWVDFSCCDEERLSDKAAAEGDSPARGSLAALFRYVASLLRKQNKKNESAFPLSP